MNLRTRFSPGTDSIYQRMVQLYPHVCEIGVGYGFNALAFLQAGAVSYSGFAMPASHKDVVAWAKPRALATKLSEVATGTIQQMYGIGLGLCGVIGKKPIRVIESQNYGGIGPSNFGEVLYLMKWGLGQDGFCI